VGDPFPVYESGGTASVIPCFFSAATKGALSTPVGEIIPNVRGWVDKLRVGPVVASIEVAESAHIEVAGAKGLVATVFPFAADYQAADSWVVLRRSVLAAGRLPAVELHESGSKYFAEDARVLAMRVSNEVDQGNDLLAEYLAQPFFVAEPWTSTPGVITDREDMLVKIGDLLLGEAPNPAG